MDIGLNTSAAVPQQQANPQNPSPAQDAGAVATLQSTPDNVVTAAVAPSDTNVRDDDALRRQGNGRTSGEIASLEALRVDGLTTRVEFDAENDQVFLEILQPQTEEVIRRIPSEGLVQFLSESFEASKRQAAALASTSGIDTSA